MTETVVYYCILIFVSGFDWRRISSTPENFLFSLEESVNYIPELTSVTTKQDTAQSLGERCLFNITARWKLRHALIPKSKSHLSHSFHVLKLWNLLRLNLFRSRGLRGIFYRAKMWWSIPFLLSSDHYFFFNELCLDIYTVHNLKWKTRKKRSHRNGDFRSASTH